MDVFTININTHRDIYKNIMVEGQEEGDILWSILAQVLETYGKKVKAYDTMDSFNHPDNQIFWVTISPVNDNEQYLRIYVKLFATEPKRTLTVDFQGMSFSEYNSNEEIMEDYRKKLIEYKYIDENEQFTTSNTKTGGCYIATAVYGSYDCPELWTFRRYRDEYLALNFFGRIFIKIYYAISPSLVRLFGETEWFNKFWRGKLDRIADDLRSKGYDDTPYSDLY